MDVTLGHLKDPMATKGFLIYSRRQSIIHKTMCIERGAGQRGCLLVIQNMEEMRVAESKST